MSTLRRIATGFILFVTKKGRGNEDLPLAPGFMYEVIEAVDVVASLSVRENGKGPRATPQHRHATVGAVSGLRCTNE